MKTLKLVLIWITVCLNVPSASAVPNSLFLVPIDDTGPDDHNAADNAAGIYGDLTDGH